jgi:hypothetical protein
MNKEERIIMYFFGGIVLVWLITITAIVAGSSNNKFSFGSDDTSVNMVSSTEYSPGQSGKIIVELRNRNGEALFANCFVNILYPDGVEFISSAQMNQTVIGTYSYDFTVPNTEGVYEYSSSCTRGSKNYVVGKSFHVSGAGIKAWVTQ